MTRCASANEAGEHVAEATVSRMYARRCIACRRCEVGVAACGHIEPVPETQLRFAVLSLFMGVVPANGSRRIESSRRTRTGWVSWCMTQVSDIVELIREAGDVVVNLGAGWC